MGRNRKTGVVISAIVLLASCAIAWVFYTFLPESPERLPMVMVILAIGIIAVFASYAMVTALPDNRWVRLAILALFGSFPLAVFYSAAFPRITYSRFGLTVYGAIPVPILDITVNRHGNLWFRAKSHRITRDEIESIISPGVEIVIVGIGWDSIAQLTDDAKLISSSIDLRVLPTPEAFAMYNRLIAEGRSVVLLAHSTC